MVERITCRCGYFAVRRDLPPGDGSDDATKGFVAGFVFAKCVFQDSSLEILRGDVAHGQTVPKLVGSAAMQFWSLYLAK